MNRGRLFTSQTCFLPYSAVPSLQVAIPTDLLPLVSGSSEIHTIHPIPAHLKPHLNNIIQERIRCTTLTMATLPPAGLPTGTDKLEYIKELINDLSEDLNEELYLPDGVYLERSR